MPSPQVAYVLLYRTPGGWRTTVAEVPRALVCGVLPDVAADSPFEVVSGKFESALSEICSIERPLEWRETQPGWWGAEVIPGALEAEGAAAE